MPVRSTVSFRGIEGVRVGRFDWGINTAAFVYRIGGTLVDAGPPNQWRPVRDWLDADPPERLLLTHHHEDHAGNAARIADRYGLVPQAPAASLERLADGYPMPPIQRVVWGRSPRVAAEPLPGRVPLADGTALEVVPAPGHSDDMVCLLWPDRGVLFAADLFLSRRLTHLRFDEDLGTLMATIERVAALEFDALLCAHRGVVEDAPAALRDKLASLTDLCGRSAALRAEGVGLAEATRRLLGREDAVSWVSAFGISKRNLVRQAARVGEGR